MPALVTGDDAGLSEEVTDDFRTSGLTHLLAVSGTNLTLVLAALLAAARALGVRGRGLRAVGVLGAIGFVILARPDPSVLRAAAMGLVALAGMTAGGRRRGLRSLCVAVLVLVLVDPWLARSAGFVLSALATGAILVLGPPWRDALQRWLPRWAAEAVAVPLAAQLACTPVVAVLSGRVSVVAVAANVLVAPAVGPATVVGLAAGVVAVVAAPVALVVGAVAVAPAWWIVAVGRRAAALPGCGRRVGGVALVAGRAHRALCGVGRRRARGCSGAARPAPPAPASWSSASSSRFPRRAGHPTAGCWWPATSVRVTAWSWPAATGRPWSSTPAPIPTSCTAASSGWASGR